MNLFFRHFGEGPSLIILHGLYGMSDNWVTLARQMAEKFEVFIPDMRNHGQSPQSPTHSYPAMAEDVLEFMTEHNMEKPIILGHSMGGKVAMLFAMENPELIERLIVIDIAPKSYDLKNVHLDILKAMMSVDFNAIRTRADVEEIINRQITDPRIRLFIQKNLFRRERNTFGWRVNLQAIADNLDLIAEGPELVGVFEKPTLFVRGGLSDYILDEDFPMIRGFFPVSLIRTIENAGHWVHADVPKKLCSLLREFTGQECPYEPEEPKIL